LRPRSSCTSIAAFLPRAFTCACRERSQVAGSTSQRTMREV
jgi:hypothetical protein